MIQETYTISKERCPACAKQGNDTRGDNLAVYNDGHKYCFSCGYRLWSKAKARPQAATKQHQMPPDFQIPWDVSPDIPLEPMNWLTVDCKFKMKDIIQNKILWSESQKWLVFPIEYEGATIGFQARNFNKAKKYKWFTKFKKKDIVKFYAPIRTDEFGEKTCVLVEDILSAIRVGNIVPTVPLFGSLISDALLLKLKQRGYKHIKLWLDHDKKLAALKYAQRARELGLSANVIISIADPKTYNNMEISHIVETMR